MVVLCGRRGFGAIQGVVIAVVIAVLEFLWTAGVRTLQCWDGWMASGDTMTSRAIPTRVRSQGWSVPWDAPLFFANAELFKDSALDAVATAHTPVEWLVVAAEPVTSVDVTAADALSELDQTLRQDGIKLCFAELKDPVKDKLKRFGLFDQIGEEFFFATIGAAVDEHERVRALITKPAPQED